MHEGDSVDVSLFHVHTSPFDQLPIRRYVNSTLSSPWQKSLRAACAGETACATSTAQ